MWCLSALFIALTVAQTPYVALLQQGRVFNDTVNVPLWERLDTTSPLPAMIAADDFTVPLAVQTCRGLVADLVLLRQLGQPWNYRVPTNVTLWLFPATALNGPFNRSLALVEQGFVVPSEGVWDPVGSSGGTTIDRGPGYYFHLERLRFVIPNVTLRSNTTYWLAALVAMERAYNATDYSQNLVRWAVSESTTVNMATGVARQYRVVDWHGTMFRDTPSLSNWTNASVAEPLVLPFVTAMTVRQSHTQQLALDVYGTQCTNVTRLPASVTTMNALPVRDDVQVPSPVITTTPTPVLGPSPAPSPPTAVTPTVVPSPPTATTPTTVLTPPPHQSTWVPSPVIPTSAVVQTPTPVSSASVPTPLLWVPSLPTPVLWSTPSPAPVPSVDTTAKDTAPTTPVQLNAVSWVLVGVAVLVVVILAGIILFVLVRLRNKTKYTSLPHDAYNDDQQLVSKDDDDDDSRGEAPPVFMDAATDIPLEDMKAPGTPEEAEKQLSTRTMLPIELTRK